MHDTRPTFTSFDELSRHLEERGFFRIEPGLDRIISVLEHFGRDFRFTTVQVLGTNGKGSTSTFLASLAGKHGLSVGLYTSPHFVTIRERVRIDGAMLSEEEWVSYGNMALEACPDLTYFEFTTAVAVLAFARKGVDLAVLEAGLGGSWDATTAVPVDCTVFTPIDMDHAAVLGPTVRDIARDKAGAVRPQTPVFSAPQSPEAKEEISAAAGTKKAPLVFVEGPGALPPAIQAGEQQLGIGGSYQMGNAALALAAWEYLAKTLGAKSADEKLTAALTSAFIPGRFQAIAANDATRLPAMLLDGAHNPHGLAGLGKALAEQKIAPAAVIFSCLADKDIESIVPHLRVLATGPVFIPPIEDNPRAMDPRILAEKLGGGALAVPSLQVALSHAAAAAKDRLGEEASAGNPVLLCGSLYLLGQFFALYPQYLEAGKG